MPTEKKPNKGHILLVKMQIFELLELPFPAGGSAGIGESRPLQVGGAGARVQVIKITMFSISEKYSIVRKMFQGLT